MSADLPDYSRSRAILIGTSIYQDAQFPPLPAVANSLRGLEQVLTSPELGGWPTGRIDVLRDPSDPRRLLQHLRRLGRDTEDVLLLYFAGHGTILPRGQLCLVLADTDAGDADITGLEYERVREVLLDSPARTKIVILDCCYSGRAIEAQSGADTVADSTDTRGAYILTASDGTAHVVAPDQQEFSATSFTGELLDLIRAGIAGGPEQLTLGLIYLHLRRRLHARGLPAPNQRGTDTADRYAFARNIALVRAQAGQQGQAEAAEQITTAIAEARISAEAAPAVEGTGTGTDSAGPVTAVQDDLNAPAARTANPFSPIDRAAHPGQIVTPFSLLVPHPPAAGPPQTVSTAAAFPGSAPGRSDPADLGQGGPVLPVRNETASPAAGPVIQAGVVGTTWSKPRWHETDLGPVFFGFGIAILTIAAIHGPYELFFSLHKDASAADVTFFAAVYVILAGLVTWSLLRRHTAMIRLIRIGAAFSTIGVTVNGLATAFSQDTTAAIVYYRAVLAAEFILAAVLVTRFALRRRAARHR